MTSNEDLMLAIQKINRKMDRIISTGDTISKPESSIASDDELDSEHGDELIRQKMPSKWTGEDFKGARMSACPADLLDLIAERFEFFASKNEDEKKAGYDRRSARRARGWAARKRNGWQSPVEDMPSSDDIPF